MSEKRNRWIVTVVMGLAFLAFVGISLAPLLSGFFQAGPSTATNSPAPTTNASPAARKAELEAQAKGYELVLQREPENPTALEGLLMTRLALNDVKGAIAPLEKLVKLNPNESRYSVLLAQAKQQIGDREGAAQTYRDVLKTKPGDTNALSGLVALLVQQNRPEMAISLLQDTLKTATQANQVQPNSVDVATVQMLLSDVYVSQKRYDEAVALYDEVAKTNKQDFRPVVGKALVLKQQGKLEEAKPLFTKAAELAPAKYKDQINQLAANTVLPTAPAGAAPAAPGSTLPVPPPAVQPSPAPAN